MLQDANKYHTVSANHPDNTIVSIREILFYVLSNIIKEIKTKMKACY